MDKKFIHKFWKSLGFGLRIWTRFALAEVCALRVLLLLLLLVWFLWRIPGNLLHEGAVQQASPINTTLDAWSGNSLLHPGAALRRHQPPVPAVHRQVCRRACTAPHARPVWYVPPAAGDADPPRWSQHRLVQGESHWSGVVCLHCLSTCHLQSHCHAGVDLQEQEGIELTYTTSSSVCGFFQDSSCWL